MNARKLAAIAALAALAALTLRARRGAPEGITVRVTTADGRVLSETVFAEPELDRERSPFCANHPRGTNDACTGCRMTRDGREVA